jgi:CspA family cold shock protein
MLRNDSDKKYYTGVVKWFSTEKGFGFIELEKKEIFACYSGIVSEGFKTLSKGQKVKFTLANGDRGPEAENIILI